MAKADSLGAALRQTFSDKIIALTILVSALGYFVDVFDLLMFSIVRVQSLKDLGVADGDLLPLGVRLLNAQAAGLLLGGVLWGVLGDKYGRVKVLFGSILMYSLANIANGFVQTVDQYTVLRFISGVGLAGEFGIGVTLASELLPKTARGIATSIITSVGVMGAVTAALVADKVDWRTAYIAGGVMGLGLLALRLKIAESGLYRKVEKDTKNTPRGNLMIFLRRAELLKRYIAVVMVGAPIWAVVGIFITFTPEFARDFGMPVLPKTGFAVLWENVGIGIGALLIGALSQKLQSRKIAIGVFLGLTTASVLLFCILQTKSIPVYYFYCALMGVGISYWAMMAQIGAEQFGTNIRATVTASVPNMVRGLAIPMTIAFQALTPVFGVTGSGLVVVASVTVLSIVALMRMKETFHTDLDYIEGVE